MYNFFLQLIIFASLAVIIYIVARALPRVSDKAEESKKIRSFSSLFSFIPLEKLDQFLNNALERLVRRTKLLVMKFDNFLSEQLGKFKKD